MKKNRTKRILSMLLTLCMVLTLVPMTAFAANAPANQVTINGVTLDSNYPYLVSGVKQSSGSLNGTTCTAHFDAVTGTLSLWNYNGNNITTGSGGAKDLGVILKGTNTITGDLRNHTDGGNLIITAEEDAFLNITNSKNSDGSLAGIATYIAGYSLGEGSISITGKANITISVTNTSTDGSARSDGLFAKQGISISGSASLDITSTCHSSSNSSAYGIYARNQSFTANTSGVIRVDVSNTQNAKPIAIRASSYSLTKVNQLLCKYNSTGDDFFASSSFTPPAEFAYNKGVVSGTPTTEIRGGSTPVRTATFVGVRNNFGKLTGQYFSGDSVGLIAETFEIPFSSWQSSAGSFSSTTSPNTTFTMPNEDVTITARYNAFNYHPYFTKTESGKGTIIFNLHALPDSAPRLVTKTGDETNIVGGTYFYGDNLPREETITDGTGFYDVPAGEYRVAVEIGYLWHFSEVFTVNYDAPVTTYAVTVTGGTGGGNYAEGATVSITANAPATGKVFDKWTTSDGVTFGNANSANTTFVMPAKAVTVTATYKDAPTTYAVTVNSGTGGGNFAAGATVSITANAPATGKVFDKWTTTDGVVFANANNATTTFTMPAKAVTVTATYKNDPETDTELSDIKVHASKGGGWENPALTPAFDREIRSYSLNLTAEYYSIYFYLGKQATGQTIAATVDGVALTGSSSGGFQTEPHTLTKATTVFVFTITAKDGNTTGTYTVTVNRGSGITHTVTVIGGTTTTPTPAEGDTVTITANEPAPGKVFDKWTTTDGVTFSNASNANTTFVMPTKAVTVTATYKDAPVTTYAVTVTGGTGGGNFAEGATVSITANAPATGKVFDKWTTTDGVTFANANSATTTFVMPAKAVTVTATYKDAPVTTYAVTVNSGTGGGNYAAGATVSITANAPATGKVFDKWTTSDGVTFGDANTATTTFVMPAKAVTVTATYKDAPVSGGGGGGGSSSTIQPTVPAANGSIQVNYTASGGTAVLTLPGSKVDEIIARSKDGEVDIDLSKMGGVTSAELPKTALTAINEAGLDVTVKFPAGSITLKKDATVSIVGQAEGGSLKLELKQVAIPYVADVYEPNDEMVADDELLTAI